MRFLLTLVLFSLCGVAWTAEPSVRAERDTPPIQSGQRVVFLGDSNTYAGKFIAYLHAGCLFAEKELKNDPRAPRDVEFLNLGLSSETASGLSEPDHPFPRPCVLDRIDRALELTKPDVVIACYGVNDAIYYPFDEGRFAKFKKGIEQICKKVRKSGAKMVLVTPPPFDALPVKPTGKLRPKGEEKYAWFAPYENYNEVMTRYADWERSLLEAKEIDFLVDLNRSIENALSEKRKDKADFTFAKDGVHFNDEGHEQTAVSCVLLFV